MDQFISWSFVQAPRTLPEHLGGDAFPGQFFHQNKNLAIQDSQKVDKHK